MHNLVLKTITFLHLLFTLFIMLAPITNSNYLQLLHSVFVPFLVVHWELNDHTCAVTIMERYIRKYVMEEEYKENECITCRLVEPVYDFKNNHKAFTKFIYSTTLALWLISLSSLYCKYSSGYITKWQQFFII